MRSLPGQAQAVVGKRTGRGAWSTVTAFERALGYYLDAMIVLAFILAASLAMVHLFAGRLLFLDNIPRSRWLSFGSGVSVAYIFVHLLPELAQGQRVLDQVDGPLMAAVESHVWLVALSGLVVFYGIERAAKCARSAGRQDATGSGSDPKVFWLHIGSFAAYNVVIGYLLVHRAEDGIGNMLLFWFAMLLHFVVNDFGLREHHRLDYTHFGRWVLGLAVVGGWFLGVAFELSEPMVAVLLAFIGGGVVLNVMKEELPEERDSSFVFFAGGAIAYALVLLSI